MVEKASLVKSLLQCYFSKKGIHDEDGGWKLHSNHDYRSRGSWTPQSGTAEEGRGRHDRPTSKAWSLSDWKKKTMIIETSGEKYPCCWPKLDTGSCYIVIYRRLLEAVYKIIMARLLSQNVANLRPCPLHFRTKKLTISWAYWPNLILKLMNNYLYLWMLKFLELL